MGAKEIFNSLFENGVFINAVGEKLVFQSKHEPDKNTLDIIKNHKGELIDFLNERDKTTYQNLMFFIIKILTDESIHDRAKEHFEERAGIVEHDGGLSRQEAERRAVIETLEWVNWQPS